VVLQWQPQRRVDVALIVSALAIVACLALVLVPWGQSRRQSRRDRRRPGWRSPSLAHEPAGVVQSPAPDGGPTLARPFRAEAPPAPLGVALVTGAVTGAVAAAVAMPAAGLAVGIASVVVLLLPRWRTILGLLAVALIVGAGVYTIVHQATSDVLPGGAWALSFDAASRLAWAGIVFLGADAVVEAVLGRRRAEGGDGLTDATTRPEAQVEEGPDTQRGGPPRG
jgi:hypothetical protein